MRLSVFFIYFLLISSVLSISDLLYAEIYIVPKPKIVAVNDGYFIFLDSVTVNLALTDTSGVITGLNQLKKEIAREFEVDLIPVNKPNQVIHIGIPGQNKAFRDICEKQNIWRR